MPSRLDIHDWLDRLFKRNLVMVCHYTDDPGKTCFRPPPKFHLQIQQIALIFLTKAFYKLSIDKNWYGFAFIHDPKRHSFTFLKQSSFQNPYTECRKEVRINAGNAC